MAWIKHWLHNCLVLMSLWVVIHIPCWQMQSLKNYGMSPEGNYPTTLKNKDGEQVCVVQAWQYAYVVGQFKSKV